MEVSFTIYADLKSPTTKKVNIQLLVIHCLQNVHLML